MSNDKAKWAAGYAAADLVKDGMKIGLGTGSTVYYFLKRLIERCQAGLRIKCLATSQKTLDYAISGNIPIMEFDQVDYLDMDIDGADEIDLEKNMIKGGGGALFREKIIASVAKEMVVVVDETKIVNCLGNFPLPIEISSFAYPLVVKKLNELGLEGKLRMYHENLFITDNHNLIFDANIKNHALELRELDRKILEIPGVIETGFFWGYAGRVVIGYPDGTHQIRDRL